MVTINKYIKALLHPAGGHQGSHEAHQAGNLLTTINPVPWYVTLLGKLLHSVFVRFKSTDGVSIVFEIRFMLEIWWKLLIY